LAEYAFQADDQYIDPSQEEAVDQTHQARMAMRNSRKSQRQR
jgi:hypothetical protein